MILDGKKTWEIRGLRTCKRGWIHFAETQGGDKLLGRARLVNCLSVPHGDFQKYVDRHCVASLSEVTFDRIFAWEFADAERFSTPIPYAHTPGALCWNTVKIPHG